MHSINFTDHPNLHELSLADHFEPMDSSGTVSFALSFTISAKDIKR